MYDAVIIGAGICGASVARYLAEYRLNVLLLDKASDVCEGTSKANTAIVHSGHDAEPGSLKAKYNVLGNRMYEQLCKELDVPFKQNSTLVLAFSEDQISELEALRDKAALNGVETRILTAKEALELEPALDPDIAGALLAGTGGIVSPYDLVIALTENAVMNGTELKLNAEVTGLERKDGVWTVMLASGESIDTRFVVNCAGLWADELNNMVSEDKYYITPRKGEYLIVDKKYAGTFNAAICMLPKKMATGHTKGVWVAPTVSGTILLGPTAEDVEDKNDLTCTAKGTDTILTGARLMWPSLPSRDVISMYAGLRAHCDRNDFQIGEPADAPGFINCGGIESPGITAGPAIGLEIAGNIAQRLNAEKKDDYITGRAPHRKPFMYMTSEEREQAIAEDSAYGRVVCRCEVVTEAEIRDSIRRPAGARTVDGVKRRTRAGMGRCQSGFCLSRVMDILCEELGMDPLEVTKKGPGSELLTGRVFDGEDR